MTFLDVENDPIIPELKNWVFETNFYIINKIQPAHFHFFVLKIVLFGLMNEDEPLLTIATDAGLSKQTS